MPQGDHRDNHYSPETRDILGRMPSWIVRWGITLLFIILAGLVLGCYFIKYPETVAAPIVITTENPPADLVARSDGLLEKVYVGNGHLVSKGDLIAVINNPADFTSMFAVRDSLSAQVKIPAAELVYLTWIDNEYRLGDVQATYSEFRSRCLEFRNYLEAGTVTQKKRLISDQIIKNREYLAQLRKQERLLGQEMEIEKKNLSRDSLLHAQGTISAFDYDTSQRSMLQKQSSLENFVASLISTELSILQSEQQLVELDMQLDKETSAYERSISQARQQLSSQISQWDQRYVIKAPFDGRVTFTKYWSDNQRVKNGDRIASVIPSEPTKVIGRMYIPMAGLGKVREEQAVNVKLNGYPYMEFGILKGKIASISGVPEVVADNTAQMPTEAYIADIFFPDGLVTTYGKELNMIHQMDGTAEIITKPRRLIHRFLDPIKALFDEK